MSIQPEATSITDDSSRESLLIEIASTNRAIQKLRERRQQLHGKLNLSAPIMKILPLDILLEIFYLAVETQFCDKSTRSGRISFLIATVCRSWRRLALDNSKIWSCIFLDYDSRSEDRLLMFVKTWVDRSGTYPLRIRLENRYGTNPNPKKVLAILLKEAYRWSTFDSFYFAALYTSKVSPKSFPRLNSLAIQVIESSSWTFSNPSARPITMFKDTLIQHFGLNDFPVASLDLDFTHIKSLAGRWPIAELTAILRNTPLLEVCWVSVHNDTQTVHETTNEPSLLLPGLEVLRVEGHIATGLSYLLSRITAPRLKVFRVEDLSTAPSSTTWPALTCQLIQRSGCQLQALWVSSSIDIVGLLDVFRATPSIQQLTLQSRHPDLLNNALIDAFELLPNLVDLKLEGAITFKPAGFIQAIRPYRAVQGPSGMIPPKTLKAVSVKYTNSKWGWSHHPNVLRDFYKDMVDIERNGTSFIFDCVDTVNQPLNRLFF